VIFELAQRDTTDLVQLRRLLRVDAGYLSRILSRFEADGIATRERSETDGRRQVASLTEQGRAAFGVLDQRAAAEAAALLSRLGVPARRRVVGAMRTIQDTLIGHSDGERCVLRPPGPGDLGWVVQRHGALYAQEYGWDESFEALVARIVADHLDNRDAEREAAWLAELDGVPVGCVLCVRSEETVAQLRLLLVEPQARGMGIGGRLVDRCIEFARASGYEHLVLWTNEVLEDARRIYERAGFDLVGEQPHRSFGRRLVGQTWRLPL